MTCEKIKVFMCLSCCVWLPTRVSWRQVGEKLPSVDSLGLCWQQLWLQRGNCRQNKTKEKSCCCCCLLLLSPDVSKKMRAALAHLVPCLDPLGSLMVQRETFFYIGDNLLFMRGIDCLMDFSIDFWSIFILVRKREGEDSIFSPRLFDKVGRDPVRRW